MTQLETLARPYAVAAFETAKTDSAIWSQALCELSRAVSTRELQMVLKNPAVSKEKCIDLLESFLPAALENHPKTQEHVFHFIALLSEKKRLLLLPAISTLFEKLLAKEKGFMPLTVTSAFEIDANERERISEKLTKQLNSKLQIHFKVDKTVIGGLLIRSNDWVMDGTIKGSLERLEAKLM